MRTQSIHAAAGLERLAGRVLPPFHNLSLRESAFGCPDPGTPPGQLNHLATTPYRCMIPSRLTGTRAMTANPAIAALNRRNKDFWQDEKCQMDRRMADDAVRECALEVIYGELCRRLPTHYQSSIESALADAERAKHRFLSQQARMGGKAGKADRLNELIREIVQRRPTVTAPELLELLHGRKGAGTIEDIDEEAIWFTTRDGGSKRATISGLKDRLSRAKRDLNSR